MKLPSATRLFQIGCALAAIISDAMRAEAQTIHVPLTPSPPPITNVDFPQIGTPEKLEAFAVHTVNSIFIWAYAYNTNRQAVSFAHPVWYGSLGPSAYIYGPLTNKTEMDQGVIASQINQILSAFMATNDPSLNKDLGMSIAIDCKAYSGIGYLDTFYAPYTWFYLVKSNGSYALPDISQFSTQLNSDIPLYIPDLQWARYEIGYTGSDNPFVVDDDRLSHTTNPIDSYGFLDLPTGYMSDSSSTNGTLWMKISAFADGKFWIWNGDGTQIPETSMRLNLQSNKSGVMVVVNGGDSGRGFVLQSSTNLMTWTNCSPITFVPTNAPPNLVPTVFGYPFTNGPIFFRTFATNIPPS